MEEIIKQILTEYGPLGAGWIVAVFLWLRLTKLQDKLIEIVKDGTTATVSNTAVLDALKDAIRGSAS